MVDVNKDSNHSTEGGADRPLPWVARFILFVLILLLAAFMIGLPVWSIQRYGATTEIDLWGPVLATLLGLTTMTVSGIFMFMTFRIDRGTKLKAEWTAKEIAEKTVREVIDKVVGKQIAVAQETIRNELAAAKRTVVKIEVDLARAKSDIDASSRARPIRCGRWWTRSRVRKPSSPGSSTPCRKTWKTSSPTWWGRWRGRTSTS